MGLRKGITLSNGVSVSYHRIVSINNITNVSTIIEVGSYTSEEKREEEKVAIQNAQSIDVFIDTEYINKDYTENMTIEQAYDYLKTLDKFKSSEDY
jgi:hypothetical protein